MRDDISLAQIEAALHVWRQTPQLGFTHHHLIDHLLIALEKRDLEHFKATCRWLVDEHFQLLSEAIAVARHFGILKEWPHVEEAVV